MKSVRVALSSPLRSAGIAICLAALVASVTGSVLAADVVRPARVAGLLATHGGGDVSLTWEPADLDAAGQSESIDYYKVYRGLSPDFVPDKAGGSNMIGTSSSAQYTDDGAAEGPVAYYYLIGAVDTSGNESDTKNCTVVTPPTLSIVTFRMREPGHWRTRMLQKKVNESRRVFLSGTKFGGRHVIRICVLSFRTHRDRIDEALAIIADAARDLAP